MVIISKEWLINILFILLPLLIFPVFYLLKYIYRIEKLKDYLFMTIPMISIFLCMIFPFYIGDGLSWDLRRIPFILGLLYFGHRKGLIILSFLLVLRFFIGGISGFYIIAFTFICLAVLIGLVKPYYVKMSLAQKLCTNGMLVLISIQLTYVSAKIMGITNLTSMMWLQFFLINFVGILITTLFIEIIKMNSELLNKLVKAEKLEVVSHLAASISHEVRNPLTACKGFLQLSHGSDVSPEVKNYISTAIQELDRATDIINDYLTFAKPAPDAIEKISICKEVQHVVNVLTPIANMNNVQLRLRLDEGDPSYILGDRKKLEQSLINIVKNGIESMTQGGELAIQAVYEFPFARITIRDEGKGMTQHQINRLGEPYFTTKENGTGLGMMVSYSIIKGMGGQIKVDSELGKWTSFSVELPIVQ